MSAAEIALYAAALGCAVLFLFGCVILIHEWASKRAPSRDVECSVPCECELSGPTEPTCPHHGSEPWTNTSGDG